MTTGLSRANGHVERLNCNIISLLTKLSLKTKWYQCVPKLQEILNSTYYRSIDITPFELLMVEKDKIQEDLKSTCAEYMKPWIVN